MSERDYLISKALFPHGHDIVDTMAAMRRTGPKPKFRRMHVKQVQDSAAGSFRGATVPESMAIRDGLKPLSRNQNREWHSEMAAAVDRSKGFTRSYRVREIQPQGAALSLLRAGDRPGNSVVVERLRPHERPVVQAAAVGSAGALGVAGAAAYRRRR